MSSPVKVLVAGRHATNLDAHAGEKMSAVRTRIQTELGRPGTLVVLDGQGSPNQMRDDDVVLEGDMLEYHVAGPHPADPDDPPEDNDKFQFMMELRRWDHGVVWLARLDGCQHLVAVKAVDLLYAEDGAQEALQHEIDALNGPLLELQDVYVPKVEYAGKHKGFLLLATKHIENGVYLTGGDSDAALHDAVEGLKAIHKRHVLLGVLNSDQILLQGTKAWFIDLSYSGRGDVDQEAEDEELGWLYKIFGRKYPRKTAYDNYDNGTWMDDRFKPYL